MTAKAADIDVAEAKCTPAELTISWQNSSYSVYSSLWLRDNAPAHRDPRTGQRLISLVDLPLEPRLHSAELWPPDHITVSWDDGETAVFSLHWLHEYDRSLHLSARPTRLPWMGQPATRFVWSAYPHWTSDASAREDWLYYVGRDGLAFLSDVPVQDAAVLAGCRTDRLRSRDQPWPHLRRSRCYRRCLSTLAIRIVIRCLASNYCTVSQPWVAAVRVFLSTEWPQPSAFAPMMPTLFPRSARRRSCIAFKMPTSILRSSGPCLR